MSKDNKGKTKAIQEIEETKELKQTMGSNLRAKREAHNLTIENLSELLNNTPGFIGAIETGRRGITPLNLKRLSKIFNVPIDDFFSAKSKSHNDSSKISRSSALKISENKEFYYRDTTIEKIRILLHTLDDKELKFIINTIENIKKLRLNCMEQGIHSKDKIDIDYYNSEYSSEITNLNLSQYNKE